ncbi:MAG TPA: cupin domain-containing protein [Candidatus Saccharimonadales bacterium]|nr:cupin domain-containing protein [Candidatus Saccharimonadales bacterium]
MKNQNNTAEKKVVVASPYKSKAIFGAQGQRLIPMITQTESGSTGISSCMVYMPPGRFARAHLHAENDIIVTVLEGYAASLIGPEFEPVFHGPGESIFIPEGVMHVAVNLSTKNRLIALEVRTDPTFNDDVVPLPEYEEKAAEAVTLLQKQYAEGTLNVPDHWDINNTDPFRFADVDEASLS